MAARDPATPSRQLTRLSTLDGWHQHPESLSRLTAPRTPASAAGAESCTPGSRSGTPGSPIFGHRLCSRRHESPPDGVRAHIRQNGARALFSDALLRLRAAVTYPIIRVPLEWNIRVDPLHPRVENIMQVQVARQRADSAPLRITLRALFPRPFGQLYRSLQPPLDIEHPPGLLAPPLPAFHNPTHRPPGKSSRRPLAGRFRADGLPTLLRRGF